MLYRITTSPNGKGRLEGTAEAVAGSDSLKSADSKEIKQSKVAEAKGKRQLKVVAGIQQKKPNEGSLTSTFSDDHERNQVGRME